MATPRSTARKLCTETEYRLVEESFPNSAADLTARAVRGRIVRARRLRDKYRRQASGRVREIRGKAPQRRRAPARSNDLTKAKLKLFDETLARFEKRLALLEAAERPSGDQVTLARKALAQKRAARAGRPVTPVSRTARKGMTSKAAGGRKGFFPAQGTKKGVLSAAVKRGQAKRDAR